MKQFQVILIDDERLAREELKRHLESHTDFIIVGEAADADEAEALIRTIKPDVLFLDIKMPGRSGIELLESLDHVPEVIFTTAYDEFAVKAFEVNAIDYLVKPIREERFSKSITRLKEKYAEQPSHGQSMTTVQSLFVKEGERVYFVKINNISLIESAGNYARLYFDDAKVLIRRSLSQLEKTLDATLFFRVNRQEIINTSFISNIQSLPNGQLNISLQTGKTVAVSSRQSNLFKNKKF